MLRTLFCTLAVALLASGCCGPMGVGPGCGISNCNDCDGTYVAPTNPIQSLMQLRRDIVCGSGCGETYYGEWTSTPPDCEDPCVDGQFVGGAVKARPFCWAPGTIANAIIPNLYGGRYCGDCGEGFMDCQCEGGGEVVQASGDCDCATCDAKSNPTGTRMAKEAPMQTRTMNRTARKPSG